ncbi:MAG TPA: diaminopimelate epimerase [Sphingomonas sp.]|nr:diaminopimelate epimerase [Sphingomonas sp.]
MAQRFHKMHGLGNDFVVFDARERAVAMSAARARAIADRHTGIGCDQLILIEPSDVATAKMRIFNADGGEVEACGNATRCVATLLGGEPSIETLGGILSSSLTTGGASIDMGAPRFEWDAVPLAFAMDTAALPLGWDGLEPLAAPMALSVGNPHIIFFVPDTHALDLAAIGPVIEHDPVFPERVNVNVATVESPDRIRLRVWERGAGLTLACGTGACATAVAAIQSGRAKSGVTVSLPGGDLIIDWQPGSTILMTGPATHVFTGELDLDAFGDAFGDGFGA